MKTKIDSIKPIRDHVMIVDMNFESRTSAGGIILNSDNGKDSGIRPRWGRVYAVGSEQTDVKPGEWILVEHGRWTRGFELEDGQGQVVVARFVETKAIMMVSDQPHDDL